MKKCIVFIMAVVMLFFVTACGLSEQKNADDNTIASVEDLEIPPTSTEQLPDDSQDVQDVFDPYNPNQPEVIAVQSGFANAIKKNNFPFKISDIASSWSDESEIEFSFYLEYDDIVKQQYFEVSVYAYDENMQTGFEVYLNPDCEDGVIKDVILCSILAIDPEIDYEQAERYLLQMTDGFAGNGRSNIIDVNGYKMHISQDVLLRTGSGGYRGYPMLHVVFDKDLYPQSDVAQYKHISAEMNVRDLVQFTGVVEKDYNDNYSYVLEVSDGDTICGIYYMQDKFAGCFEVGQSYIFYGQFAGERGGYRYSLKLDGFEEVNASSHINIDADKTLEGVSM